MFGRLLRFNHEFFVGFTALALVVATAPWSMAEAGLLRIPMTLAGSYFAYVDRPGPEDDGGPNAAAYWADNANYLTAKADRCAPLNPFGAASVPFGEAPSSPYRCEYRSFFKFDLSSLPAITADQVSGARLIFPLGWGSENDAVNFYDVEAGNEAAIGAQSATRAETVFEDNPATPQDESLSVFLELDPGRTLFDDLGSGTLLASLTDSGLPFDAPVADGGCGPQPENDPVAEAAWINCFRFPPITFATLDILEQPALADLLGNIGGDWVIGGTMIGGDSNFSYRFGNENLTVFLELEVPTPALGGLLGLAVLAMAGGHRHAGQRRR